MIDANPTTKEDRTKALLEELEQGIGNLANQEEWLKFLEMNSKLPNYSFNNLLLIARQNPDATLVASYNFFKSHGEQIEKGQKSIAILAPCVYNREVEDETTKEKKKESYIKGFTAVSVFDVSQTISKGANLPKGAKRLEGAGDEQLLSQLIQVAKDNGFRVEFQPIQGETNGWCKPEQKLIAVDSSLSGEMQLKTLSHELGHALAEHSCSQGERSVKELQAESTAFITMRHFGFTSGQYSFAYVAGWSGGTDEALKELKTSGALINSTAKKIITSIEAQQAKIEGVTESTLEMNKKQQLPKDYTIATQSGNIIAQISHGSIYDDTKEGLPRPKKTPRVVKHTASQELVQASVPSHKELSR
jgi:hypothetical protein